MQAQDLSTYRKAVRTKDGRLPPPPEPALGDSVMSGRLLISGRHLILTHLMGFETACSLRQLQLVTGDQRPHFFGAILISNETNGCVLFCMRVWCSIFVDAIEAISKSSGMPSLNIIFTVPASRVYCGRQRNITESSELTAGI